MMEIPRPQTRMSRWLARFAVVALFQALFGVAICAAADVYTELLHRSGLWTQVAAVEGQFQRGLEDAHATQRTLTQEQVARLRRAASAAYATDRLREGLSARLRELLGAEDADAALAWFASSLGARIVNLEADAGASDLSERQREASRAYAALPESRKELLKRLLDSAGASALFATVAVNQIAGVARGASIASGRAAPSDSEVEERTRLFRAQLEGAIGPLLLAHGAVVYASVSDEELARYVEFLTSRSGRAMVSALNGALEAVLGAAAVDFGQRIARDIAPEHDAGHEI